jgi:hypothetical protein
MNAHSDPGVRRSFAALKFGRFSINATLFFPFDTDTVTVTDTDPWSALSMD